MPRKAKPEKTELEKLQLLAEAGIKRVKVSEDSDEVISSLAERVQKILDISTKIQKKRGCMLFFVMYDIEDNKVRRLVVKYLQRKGCWRVQKSIFLAEAPFAVYEEIKTDLANVQAVYENNDSIIVLPITTDYLQMMKIIGKEIDVDIITRQKSTIFF
jgi:CRISPR-associated protein Cas2